MSLGRRRLHWESVGIGAAGLFVALVVPGISDFLYKSIITPVRNLIHPASAQVSS